MIFDYQRRIQALEARVQALEDALKNCLPGSKVQQIARDKGIPVRPLSEFQMEDA